MKILYICHRWPYPPKRGGKIRPFNMISHLSERHEVTVASLVRSDAEADEGRPLADHCHAVVQGHISTPAAVIRMVVRLPTLVPSSMGYFYSPEVADQVKTLVRQESFDLIFVHCSSVAQYVSDVEGVPKILDFGDMDSQKWHAYSKFKPWPLSMGYWLESTKLEREEKRLARRFDMATCTTKLELDTLNSYGCARDTDWFPNGVDHEFFHPVDDYDPDLISFIGRMDYYPNQQCMIEFCETTLPLVRRLKSDAKLLIIGADPSKEIRDLGRLAGVEVTGSVDDVRPYVRRSAVNVAPLAIARGTQNKILEAMAMGVPVVASEIAGLGIDAISPDHFLSANDAEGYARAIVEVLNNPAERDRLAQAGRARMLSHHHWPASLERLDAIIERCVRTWNTDTAQAADTGSG